MNPRPLGVPTGYIGIFSMFIVKYAHTHPVGSTLAKILALVNVVTRFVGKEG